MTDLRPTHTDVLRRLLRQRAGITLETGKEYLVRARLGPLAEQAGLASVGALIERVDAGTSPLPVDTVVEAMTINETSFFRDAPVFSALRDTILPGLIARPGRIRIWCAAASTGQEPYSLAMLIREYFADQAGRFDILATDIATTALARAEAARYTQLEVNRGLPAPLLVKYFRRAGRDWQLTDDVRAMVRFRRHNLVGLRSPAETFDLVLLRNVLIYFDESARRDVLDRIRGALRVDGWLVLGATETTSWIQDGFVRIPAARALRHHPETPTQLSTLTSR
jgi:chemotaxis protein methyltransferase CheR